MDGESTSTAAHSKKLTCPVCCDKFKTPKILQCGHTFCQQCVHELLQSYWTNCPVCRTRVENSVVIRSVSAETLPTNYALKALVEEDTCPFDKDSISRSFGECQTHHTPREQFCRTCELQLCKQCVDANHKPPDHDTAPVLAVVVQKLEIVKNVTRELRDTVERLKRIGEDITASEKTCETETEKLVEEIKSSAAQSFRNLSDHVESLQTFVQESKQDSLKYLENLRTEHSELSLSVTYAVDLCESLQMDLHKNNLSRLAVIKKLNYNHRKIRNRLEKLEGNEIGRSMGVRYDSLAHKPKVGELVRSQSSIPVAKPTRAIPLEISQQCLLRGFIWPLPHWIIAVNQKRMGKHKLVEFYNLNFFVEKPYTHEIGIDDNWLYVSQSDYSGEYILCLGERKVQKFLLRSKQNKEKTWEIVGTAHLQISVNAISWDEKQQGCYVLAQDNKTVLHIEFEVGQKEVVAVLEEEITTSIGSHVMHVNREGTMALCDHEAKKVHFFLKIGTEPTLSVNAPPDFENATPECVNTRKEDRNWYVLWKLGARGNSSYQLAVYDHSFVLLGSVKDLKVPNANYENEKALFCFQEEYLAVIAGGVATLHTLF